MHLPRFRKMYVSIHLEVFANRKRKLVNIKGKSLGKGRTVVKEALLEVGRCIKGLNLGNQYIC